MLKYIQLSIKLGAFVSVERHSTQATKPTTIRDDTGHTESETDDRRTSSSQGERCVLLSIVFR